MAISPEKSTFLSAEMKLLVSGWLLFMFLGAAVKMPKSSFFVLGGKHEIV